MYKWTIQSLDRIYIDVVVHGCIYKVDCSCITISELCENFSSKTKYVYSLFNECYYDISLLISETNIKTGDIIFL